jgi:hypothetical protein
MQGFSKRKSNKLIDLNFLLFKQGLGEATSASGAKIPGRPNRKVDLDQKRCAARGESDAGAHSEQMRAAC